MARSDARPTVLVVVSSSCQLYSGTGKALFDWIRHAGRALDFSILIDTGIRRNFEIAATFCREENLRLYPSPPEQVPGCPDSCPADVASVLRSRPWDYVECVSWANAATNLQVLNNLPETSRLLFTPHTQPLWTLPTPGRFFMVQHVFGTMLRVCDLVLMDTPRELEHIDAGMLDPARTAFVPLGVDTAHFSPLPQDATPGTTGSLFSVADFREHRKRPDLLFRAFEAMVRDDPSLQLMLAGRGSKDVPIPASIEKHVVRLGYVDDAALLHHYRTAMAFLLLSDFEAFGLPIAEALCCGTPVLTTWQKQTSDIFGDLPGVHLVDNTSLASIRLAIAAVKGSTDRQVIAAAAAERFGYEQTYARKLELVLRLARRGPPPPSAESHTSKVLDIRNSVHARAHV
jgi:glycosyltransferase involved in cell wall biosynthesis